VASTPSIKILKTLTFRGSLTTWSNRYHFNGGTPSGTTPWTTLADAIVTAEKAALAGAVPITITGAVGYEAGSEVPVFSKTYATAATGSFAGGVVTPGDTAALVRYSTASRTSKNHPLYLFNYYHGALQASAAAPDTLVGSQKTALTTYAGSWVTGFSDGSHTLVRAGPNGQAATGVLVATYLTHRDFPR
jgi:hypothetical protein